MGAPVLERKRPVRILIADDEQLLTAKTVDFLHTKGFETQYVSDGVKAREIIKEWQPDFILYDLMLPGMNALTLLKELAAADQLGEGKIRVLVTSGHNKKENVKECIRLGATDFLVKPVTHEDLFMRFVFHLQQKHDLNSLKRSSRAEDQSAIFYMHLTELLMRESLKGHDRDECLHILTGMLGHSMGAVRVSLIECDADERKGWVVASSDKRSIGRLQLDLGKYPEVLYVLRQDRLLALDNLTADPTMHFVTRQNKEISFNSMVVCPIKMAKGNWGVLSIRMPASKEFLNEFEIRYAQMAAHVMSHVIQKG
ncbi:MAG TPA: response regulator [Bdellovibrionales bacterium]|nr:response regulator [Bdellovibrionales bacterium]